MASKPQQKAPTPTTAQEEALDPMCVTVDGLCYRLDRMPSRGAGRKVVMTVRLADGGDGPPLVDRADLYAHRARSRMAALVAETFGRAAGDVMGHLAVLLDQVERAGAADEAAQPTTVVMTPAQRKSAEKLLAAPDLLDRVAKVMEALGHVGEERNKRVVYLAATSRLMPNPLNVLLLAPSGAGRAACSTP